MTIKKRQTMTPHDKNVCSYDVVVLSSWQSPYMLKTQ